MSLADKIIKNTFYYILFQFFGFIFPLILTPFIISYIGEVQFGIYALVLGFIGMFNLFDLSISSSFIVFISRYNVKKDFENLNKYFNTGLFFYFLFSVVIAIIGFIFSKPLLSLLNIPKELFETSVKVFNIGLIVFLITSSFTIFSSVLISLQKMYITSMAGILIGLTNLIVTIIILKAGYGLTGLMWVQVMIAVAGAAVNIFYAMKFLPELKVGFRHFGKEPVREMTKFGAQMQISKLATFASEKYDEFLLAYFSILNNVTYFNLANRISRAGRLIPFQILPQIAPAASELAAKGEREKLNELFSDATKYLTLVSVPVFIFIFVFSDLIITTWVGPGYELSSNILRIMCVGQLINMTFSAPGNSIIPNTGIPKYQMAEGLLNLCINIVLSFLLIKFFGIYGAAIGNTVSIIISSTYILIVSAAFFNRNKLRFFSASYIKPAVAGLVSGVISFALYYLLSNFVLQSAGRIKGIIYIGVFTILFCVLYFLMILKLKYLTAKDKSLIGRMLLKFAEATGLKKNENAKEVSEYFYSGELVSFVVVTFNRLGFLKKCLTSLIETSDKIHYELIVVDNASTDGTSEYLKKLQSSNPKIRVINPGKNIGINAKALGVENTKGEFIIGIDDDVIFFPEGWVEKMIHGYKAIPMMGYLATDVIQDETTNGAKPPPENYYDEYFDDGNITLQVGPTGGWCFMISRKVYNEIGKLRSFEGRIFYPEDGDYINRIRDKGMKYGILEGVKVYHATGEFHNKEFKKVYDEKYADYKKGEPFFYRLKTKLKKLFSVNRYIEKLNELASKNN